MIAVEFLTDRLNSAVMLLARSHFRALVALALAVGPGGLSRTR